LKEWCGNFFQCPSAIGNRKSAIPAILGQAMIVENLRRARRRWKLVLQGGETMGIKAFHRSERSSVLALAICSPPQFRRIVGVLFALLLILPGK